MTDHPAKWLSENTSLWTEGWSAKICLFLSVLESETLAWFRVVFHTGQIRSAPVSSSCSSRFCIHIQYIPECASWKKCSLNFWEDKLSRQHCRQQNSMHSFVLEKNRRRRHPHHYHHDVACRVVGLLTCSVAINSLEVFLRVCLWLHFPHD
jgi:hypothetical protein